MRGARILSATLVALAALAPLAPAVAGDPAWLPKPARGKGEQCVADTAWMRRNHMTALSHQRDATVHEGVRTARFSLKGCIDCHAVAGVGGEPVSFASERHFCRTCHDYAAVRIDCFECHASRPPAATTGGADGPSAAALAQYLRSVER